MLRTTLLALALLTALSTRAHAQKETSIDTLFELVTYVDSLLEDNYPYTYRKKQTGQANGLLRVEATELKGAKLSGKFVELTLLKEPVVSSITFRRLWTYRPRMAWIAKEQLPSVLSDLKGIYAATSQTGGGVSIIHARRSPVLGGRPLFIKAYIGERDSRWDYTLEYAGRSVSMTRPQLMRLIEAIEAAGSMI